MFLDIELVCILDVQYTMPISQYKAAIWTLSLRRRLVELADFGTAHLSNQIL